MTSPNTTDSHPSYVPAAGHDWLLPFYDPLWKLLGGQTALEEFVSGAAVEPGHRVLEIGCGTGNLTLLLKRSQPAAEIVGLDPDPKALARARVKAESAGLAIELDRGFSQELPYPDAAFDRVFSSFMFHHLDAPTKEATLREVRRVLAPGGSFHLVDFRERAQGRLARIFHSDHTLRENAEDHVLSLMRSAGLANPHEVGRHSLLLGGITYYCARAGS